MGNQSTKQLSFGSSATTGSCWFVLFQRYGPIIETHNHQKLSDPPDKPMCTFINSLQVPFLSIYQFTLLESLFFSLTNSLKSKTFFLPCIYQVFCFKLNDLIGFFIKHDDFCPPCCEGLPVWFAVVTKAVGFVPKLWMQRLQN